MDNDAKLNAVPDALGEDNADILAAKRRRTAENASSVSAGDLRARMQTSQSASQTVRKAPARPLSPPVKPVVLGKTAKTVQPSKAAVRTAQAAKQLAPTPTQSAAPAQTAPKAMPINFTYETIPVKRAPAAQEAAKPAAQSATPAPKPTEAPKPPQTPAVPKAPAKPAGQSTTPAPKPTEAPKPPQTPAAPKAPAKPAGQNVRPAVAPKPAAPKPEAMPTVKSRPSGGMHELIPHQQAGATSDKKQVTEDATRVTDIQAIRAEQPSDATRISDVRPIVPARRKDRDARLEEDESEGRNAVISVIKAITYIVSVIVVAVFLAVFIILVGNDVYAFVKDDTVIEVTVPEYATLNDVTEILHENGLIEYPNIFKIYANLKKTKKEKENGFVFLAGTYPVTPMMNYDELIAAFKEKKVTGTSRITIPEGYTTDQIIDLFVSKGIGTRDGYIDVINNYDFDYWFIDELEENGWKDGRYYRLDGYLFPDTYEFYNESSEEVVINKLLRRFNQIFVEAFTVRAAEMGYTVDEVLTIASIIEKEGGTQSDFFNISSVFHNRLESPAQFPYLESDATVVYAIYHDTGEHINPTRNDLEYESPYNTHKNAGLTPGPIANPSASAIRAALYPADTDYYYFYSASSTVTLYASTLDEHLANVAKGASGAAEPQA